MKMFSTKCADIYISGSSQPWNMEVFFKIMNKTSTSFYLIIEFCLISVSQFLNFCLYLVFISKLLEKKTNLKKNRNNIFQKLRLIFMFHIEHKNTKESLVPENDCGQFNVPPFTRQTLFKIVLRCSVLFHSFLVPKSSFLLIRLRYPLI